VGTTISGSIEAASSRQGVEINDFSQVYASMLPRFLSNAAPSIVVNGRKLQSGDAFDDSISSVLAGNKVSVVPNHHAEDRDIGMPKSHYSDTPFHEMGRLEPVAYIQSEDLHALYPVILDEVSPIDPGLLNGIIEPLPIRQAASRTALENVRLSKGVTSDITSHHIDVFGYSIPIEQKVYDVATQNSTRPYQEYGVESLIQEKAMSYFADDPITSSPYYEDKSKESRSLYKVDDEMLSVIEAMGTQLRTFGIDYRSAAAGYTFIDGINGTDSIVFMDRKGR